MSIVKRSTHFSELYIGLMSGTSMDGIDAALVQIRGESCQLIGVHQHPLPDTLVSQLQRLCQPGDDEITLSSTVTVELARHFSEAVTQLLEKTGTQGDQIKAIGSHGQTIRHFPPQREHHKLGYSLQIAHPAYIAAQTGIDVIADFRTMDLAVGGEGAPLVPAFHQQLFQSDHTNRAIVNIGGIANITWLPSTDDEAVIGYDTGPGNTLLDQWYQQHHQGQYDKSGLWAQSGHCLAELLSRLKSDPYFSRPFPKSTGRELFNLPWLRPFLSPSMGANDIQATLTALSAHTIADALVQLASTATQDTFEIYLCGGGAHNDHLIAQLQSAMPQTPIKTTAALGIDPDWVEAVAFAWLAKRHIHRQTGNLPAVTGASRTVILGAAYPA